MKAAPGVWRRAAWWTLVAMVTALVAQTTHLSLAAFTGTTRPVPPPCTAAPLPGREVQVQPSPHIPFVEARHAPYNSLPPTSGPHVPWVIMTGIYAQPVRDELSVHSLEHGHINVQYAYSTPGGQVAELRAITLRFADDVLLAPYPKLAHGIALTAWGRIEILPSVNRTAIEQFIVKLRGRYDHGWSGSWATAHGARFTVGDCANETAPGAR